MPQSIKHSLPPAIVNLYTRLRMQGVDVTLAGGAVRDILMGKADSIKDYDLLVLGDKFQTNDSLEALPFQLPDAGTFKSVLAERYSTNTRVGDVWEFQYQGLLVNIIFPCLEGDGPWMTPGDCVNLFDTTLNAAYYDFDKGEIIVDPRHSYHTGKVEFIVNPAYIGLERTKKRYQRLQPKYPDLDWSAPHNWILAEEERANHTFSLFKTVL